MATPFDDRTLVDYAKSLDCIHCGLCLQSCPTFRLTGAEASSPRGRIHLMRAVAEGRLGADADFAEEMEFCLLCRACESVCPAGVRYGAMLEHTRDRLAARRPSGTLARLARWVGFRRLLPSRRALRLAGTLVRLAQRTGLLRLAARLLGTRAAPGLDLPPVPPLRERPLLPRVTPAEGEPAGRVALLEGCVMPELLAGTNRATARTLARLGLEVRVPEGVVCCGSLHAHNGDLEGARRLARRLVPALEREGDDVPLVTNSAGCGAHLKELAHLFDEGDPWRARAARVAARVRDYSEVVAPRLAARPPLRVPSGALPGPIAWDDPCHLCHGQGVRAEPRAVLAGLEGVELRPLAGSEACCGSAGLYAALRPDDARAVFAPKREAFAASGARVLVTANPGCQLQWRAGLARAGDDAPVLHLAELVDLAVGPRERA